MFVGDVRCATTPRGFLLVVVGGSQLSCRVDEGLEEVPRLARDETKGPAVLCAESTRRIDLGPHAAELRNDHGSERPYEEHRGGDPDSATREGDRDPARRDHATLQPHSRGDRSAASVESRRLPLEELSTTDESPIDRPHDRVDGQDRPSSRKDRGSNDW